MGLFDFLKRKKTETTEEVAKYVLTKRDRTTGGMAKAMDLAGPTKIEDIYKVLDAGIYQVQKYVKGKSGFEIIDGPLEVTGSVATGAEGVEKTGAALTESEKLVKVITEDLDRGFKWLTLPQTITDALKAAVSNNPSLAGVLGQSTPPLTATPSNAVVIPQGESFDEWFTKKQIEFRKRFEETAKVFDFVPRGSVTGEQPPEYDGKLPIWLHPQGIPKLVETVLNEVDKKFQKWNLVGSEETKKVTIKPESSLFRMPQRPESKQQQTEQKSTNYEEKKEEKEEKKDEQPKSE